MTQRVQSLIYRRLRGLLVGSKIQKGSLESFSEPRDYWPLLQQNIARVEELTRSQAFSALTKVLCEYTGIDSSRMTAIASRQLLVANESGEEAFAYRPLGVWFHFLGWLSVAAIRRLIHRPDSEPVALLFGDWGSGGTDGSRYKALIREADRRGITSCVIDLDAEKSCTPISALRSVPTVLRAFSKLRQVQKELGLNAHWIAASVMREHLIGSGWTAHYKAGVLFTALDNGNLYVRANAANLTLVLAQNGCRSGSDACYIVSDHYLALEPLDYGGCLLSETGRFRAHQAGSLALANYWTTRPAAASARHSDILWVSDFPPPDEWDQFDRVSKHVTPLNDFVASLHAFLEFAKKHEMGAAFFPRWPGEYDAIKARGVDLEGVHCFDRSSLSVYEAMTKADLVLSSFSTVAFEAMMIKKPVGFIFLTANHGFNQFARQQHLLFDGNGENLAEFLEGLPLHQPLDGPFVIAPEQTLQIMIDVVSEALVERTAAGS